MKDGVQLAAEIIDSGKAMETLNKMIEVSNRPEA
jgi:anthranilate phosphoribosyltransferase